MSVFIGIFDKNTALILAENKPLDLDLVVEKILAVRGGWKRVQIKPSTWRYYRERHIKRKLSLENKRLLAALYGYRIHAHEQWIERQ